MKSNIFFSSFRILALAVLALCSVAPQPAVGATYWVTNNSDGLVPGSLREAVAYANALGGGTILFSNVTGTITLIASPRELVVTHDVNIVGPGADVLAISASGGRAFKILSHTVVISGLTIRDGRIYDSYYPAGGGIYINSGANLTLVSCVISNNSKGYDHFSISDSPPGGGIANYGILTMSNCLVSGNSTARGGDFKVGNNGCSAGGGGGLYNAGAATLTDCTFRNNSTGGGGDAEQYGGFGGSGGHGGGVYNAGVLSLTRCTLSGNCCGSGGYGLHGDVPWDPNGGRGGSGGSGGGIYNSATLFLTNCTLFGNATGQGMRGAAGGSYNIGYWLSGGNGGRGGSGGGGGGICNSGGLTLHACTVSGNTTAPGGSGGWGGIGFPPGTNGIPGVAGSPGDGGGICGAGTVFNCLVAQNEAFGVGPDISGPFTSLGYNLIGNTNGSTGFGASGDILNVDPLLGPLADNGGPTYTMALLPGSPAIDKGSAAGLITDQRGKPRPYDFVDIPNASDGADIGAHEVIGPAPAPSGMAAWWPGNGSAQDIIGTNHGTLMNGANYATGKVGQAFTFDGVDDYMAAPPTALSNVINNFTMEFWTYPTAGRAGTSETTSGVYGAGGQRYAIFPYFSDGDTGAGVSVGTNGISVFEHGGNYLPSLLVYDGVITGWTHVAVVYTNKQPSLYVNGVLARTGLSSTRPYVHPSPGIGGYNWYGYFAGLMDEVTIYNRALSAAEIVSIYTAGSAGKRVTVSGAECVAAPSGLTGWWRAENDALDNGGLNNGFLEGSVGFSGGEVGHAFVFGTSNIDVKILASTSLDVGISDGLTIEAWVNPAADPLQKPLVEWNSGSAWGVHFWAATTPGTGQLYANIVDTLSQNHPIWTTTNVLATNLFQHVAVTYDKVAGLAIIYRNGIVVAQNVLGSFIPLTSFDLYFGRRISPTNELRTFLGLIDEISIYNRALSSAEIASIYVAGSAGKCFSPAPPILAKGWGLNGQGQAQVPQSATDLIAIAAGVYHSLALRSDGTVVGWGENDFGQTQPPAGLTNVTAIAAGWGTSLALKRDGTLAEWGWDGGYGLKSTAESLTNITALSACWDCLMALKRDGTVTVWGKSTHEETNVPVGLTGVTAIAGGGAHCLALKRDGMVVGWGDNSEGQSHVPAGLTGVVGIAAGGYHSLALQQDGAVVVWGRNSSGQANVPTELSNVVAISGGMAHSLALQSSGSIAAWGDNSSGQTNVPANLTNVVAIAAGGYHNLALTGSRAPWTKFNHICCTGNQVHFTVAGLCGDVYQIMASTNLVDWQCLCTQTNVTGTVEFTDAESSAFSQRFYRIVMP